ncbi:MAG: hypothetical protein Q9166_002834 [cf. Caloplaca sp. 2 TL-2023]
MLPRELVHDTIALDGKPGANIHYTFAPEKRHQNSPRRLVVFLNGLMTDKSTWLPVMANIMRKYGDHGYPALLAYDRYGQGLTEDRDPQDQGRGKGRGHDVGDVVRDLQQLILQIDMDRMSESRWQLHLVFVANSIGCAVARLYAEWYPGFVEGLLLLDSMMANSNFDWWPDPESKDFNPKEVPEDVTIEVLHEQRSKFATFFAPDVINREGLDRRNLAEMLPHSNKPWLQGPQGRGPVLTVVEHDPVKFASESLQSMGTPISLSMKYTNPIWHEYNQGLLQITDPNLSVGPIVARDCGHFVQRDDPSFVTDQLSLLLSRLQPILSLGSSAGLDGNLSES